MKKNLKHSFGSIIFTIITLYLLSCEKDQHNPPKLEFKIASGYVSADKSLPKDTTIHIGIIATKTEDEFKSYNASYFYDNSSTSNTLENTSISKAEEDGFTRDYSTIKTRNQAGTEKYTFTVVDKDGNVGSISLNFTVK
jgi:hypothetical protein